jgi:lysophospholipase L1-like esterase
MRGNPCITHNILLFIGLFLTILVKAQEADYYLGRQRYAFINYSLNEFQYPSDNSALNTFFLKIDSVVAKGKGKIKVVHFGGSHIQADIYTHIIRQHLQELSPDMNGGRGLIFPMKMAHMYNPSNFEVSYSGTWETCKCTDTRKSSRLGIACISVTTSDTLATIRIIPNKENSLHYTFNQVKVFHEPTQYMVFLSSADSLITGSYDIPGGFTRLCLDKPLDTLKLYLHGPKNGSFTLQGISLDNDAPGLVYNAIGVNGAKLSSYLQCELYENQLQTIHPDLIIFSIGTNDGYTRNFDAEQYRNEYRELLQKTRKAAPEAAILLTVPNDSYLYRKYVNQNTKIMQEVIFSLAEEYNCTVWDFYSVMGGLNSSQAWRSAGLMQNDRVHFNQPGYELIGELLFSAFLKGWEQQLNQVELISEITR